MAKADSTLIYRYSALDGAKIDRAARTVPISFSSELPAMQRENGGNSHITGLKEGDIYVEILDHDPANVDLSQLNNRGAFLDEHDDKDQIGVVEKAEVDAATRRGLAVVKLSAHEKGMRRFAEMEANDRPHISAGYKYTKLIRSEKLPNGRMALRFAWAGKEISSVAVPNDPSVGVARAYQDLPEVDSSALTKSERSELEILRKSKNMKTPEEIAAEKLAADATATAVLEATTKTRSEVAAKVASDLKTRTKEITSITDALITEHGAKDGGKLADKIRKLANETLQDDTTLDQFKVRCMTDIMKAEPVKPIMIADCTDDPSQYSLLRGIQSCINRKDKIPDGREGEVHQEMIRRCGGEGRLGFDAKGFQVPHNAPMRAVTLTRGERDRMRRDMQATVFNAGGAMVPTILQTPIIELLRNMMVLDDAGVTTLGGLTGNVVIPRQEAAATAYSVSEIGALTTSQQVLGQIAITPKRVGATETYSKQLLMQSSPDVEAFIRDDLFKVIALKWDYLGLNGQGAASEPLGIMNAPGIGAVTFGATPTYAKIILFETLIRAANVPGEIVYMTDSTVKGALKGVAEALSGATAVINGAQNALWKPDDKMNGKRAIDSQQIPNHVVIAGVFSQLLKCLFGGLDVVVDPFTKAANGEIVLTINTWGDYAIRHPQAFVVSTDAGNQ